MTTLCDCAARFSVGKLKNKTEDILARLPIAANQALTDTLRNRKLKNSTTKRLDFVNLGVLNTNMKKSFFYHVRFFQHFTLKTQA